MLVDIEKIKPSQENPRTINVSKLTELKKSIKDFPEMMKVRPIVVDEDYNIIGGNMRYLALKELGYKEIEVEVLSDKTKNYEFMIKDNLSYGDWDWSVLSEDFKSTDLLDFGLDVPVWFRDLEKSIEKNDKEEDTKQNFEDLTKKKEEEKKSTKKALYLFYSSKEKKEVIDSLNAKKTNDESNEFVFIELIKKFIKENERN